MGRTAKLSLSDVAKAAGVSLATASRALNNAYGVSEATRARVLATAERLDFVVSPQAADLARGTTRRVALVVPHIDRWFFGSMINGIAEGLATSDLDLLLYPVDGPEEREWFFTKLPARRKVDAVIVVGFPVARHEQQQLELMGVTIVAAGGQSATYPHVCIDDYAAGRAAVDHLLGLGHRRIAMIAATDPDQPGWPRPRPRSRAYEEALAAAGVELDARLVREIPWSGTQAAAAVADILDGVSAGEAPTAVYVHSDELAFGVLGELQRRGIAVPGDISVVAIDDHPVSALLHLTTVHQSVEEQGRAAAAMLLDLLSAAPTPRAVITPTSLVERGSTAPPRSR